MASILLIVDRQAQVRRDALCSILEQSGHTCEITHSRRAGIQRLRAGIPDVVLVDLASLHTEGVTVCSGLYNAGAVCIVAIATQHKPEVAAVDRWIIEPFSPQRLLDTISDVVRRAAVLTVSTITLDLRNQTVTNDAGDTSHLTPKEFRLLRLLMRNAGTTVTRATIMNEVWETDYTDDTRTLDVHIRWLREKTEANPSEPIYIKTVRGTGYRFVDPENVSD